MAIDVVVDLSHWQGAVNLRPLARDGILGVIHKATQGTHAVDSRYRANRTRALAIPLLWGAYHFATGEDAAAQADHFLATVQPDRHTLLALDLENNPAGSTMSLDGAIHFVTRVHEHTGRWPVLYSGNLIKELLGNRQEPTLANCPLWLAQYGPRAIVPANWKARGGWALWQYTDRRRVGGLTCDSDRFWGTAEQLRSFWLNE